MNLLVWSAYLLWRAPEWGLLTGIPLTPLSLAAICLASWVWWITRELPRTRWIAFLLLTKAVCALILVPRGLHASYFTNGSWQGSPQRELRGAWPDETRIDDTLAFSDGATFPLHFLNVNRPDGSAVFSQPFSIAWQGVWDVKQDVVDQELYLKGENLTAEALVDGFPVVSLSPSEPAATGRVRLRSGLRGLTVKVSSASGIPKSFEAGFVDPSSQDEQPFGRHSVLQARVPRGRLQVDRLLRPLTVLIDVIVLGLLGFTGMRTLTSVVQNLPAVGWRTVFRQILPLAAVIEALFFAQHTWGRFEILGWGTDRITYETFARDIIFNGPLMTLQAPLGRGDSFHFQPLYPYFLAAAHLLTGEGLWGVYVLQRIGLALVVYSIWMTAEVLFDARTAFVALILAFWFGYERLHDFSAALYNESLYVPLLCFWMLWLCRDAAAPGTQRPLAGAVSGGLATLTRSTLLAAIPFIGLCLAGAYRRHRQSLKRPLVMFAEMGSVIGVATLRNWIVAREFALVVGSTAWNYWLGNEPPPEVMPPADGHWWLDLIAKDELVRKVFEYAYHSPGVFAKSLLAKAAYILGIESSLGVTRPLFYLTTIPINPQLVWIWIAALAGAVILWRSERSSKALGFAQSIPALLAFSQFLVLVAFQPYSERFVLPVYALILVYAAVPFGLLASLVRKGD